MWLARNKQNSQLVLTVDKPEHLDFTNKFGQHIETWSYDDGLHLPIEKYKWVQFDNSPINVEVEFFTLGEVNKRYDNQKD